MRTVDSRKLASAARELGDAVLDPGVWPRILQQISDAAGATGAALVQSDIRTPDIPRTASVDDCFKHYFATGWHAHDTRAERGLPLLTRGKAVITDQDLVTPEEMQRLAFYNECAFPFGVPWFAGIGLRAGPALWVLVILRGTKDEPFSPAEARRLATLSDRLTEVATLSTAVGRVALSSATQALDRVGQPAVAVDRDGAVIEGNSGAERIFDTELYIDRRGQLCVLDARARGALQKLFDRLRVSPGTEPVETTPIIVRRKGSAPVIVRALPVPGSARVPFGGARALLTFSPVEPRRGPDAVLISDVFGLTRAEAEVAARVAEGKSLAEIADARGIARVTVRNQMRTILAKTGTHRQSELVALLAKL